MATETVPAWTEACCSGCGVTTQATRAQPRDLDLSALMCGECETWKKADAQNDERVRGLEAKVLQLEEEVRRIEREKSELESELARVISFRAGERPGGGFTW